MTTEQLAILRQVYSAIVEAVQAAGSMGAPGGHLYAALMAQGCTLNQFESLMAGMVKAGKLRRDGDCYFIA